MIKLSLNIFLTCIKLSFLEDPLDRVSLIPHEYIGPPVDFLVDDISARMLARLLSVYQPYDCALLEIYLHVNLVSILEPISLRQQILIPFKQFARAAVLDNAVIVVTRLLVLVLAVDDANAYPWVYFFQDSHLMDFYFVLSDIPETLQSNQNSWEDKVLYFTNVPAFYCEVFKKFSIRINLMTNNLLYFVILNFLDLFYFIGLTLARNLCQSLL